jgi:imidazole glycerol-phosphate synthase subunit HisF
MLKIRLVPTLLFKDYGLVKGVGFDSWRRTGSAMQAVKVYNLRKVDEIIFLDIGATLGGRPPNFSQIDQLADECFMPMTVGGGVSKIEDFRQLLMVGADKVSINTAAIRSPELVRHAAERFGSQCVVVAIDVKREASGRHRVFSHCGTAPTELDPVAWAQEVATLGAGEILLTSIDRDGTMRGYDIEITRRIADAVSIPVVASGGAGDYAHFAEAVLVGRASAVAAASIFHFTEKTPLDAKRYMNSQDIAVRL